MSRKTPVLLREGPLTGTIQALTRYTRKTVRGREVIQAATEGKHDVTADFDALVLETLLGDDCPDMAATLDGAARAMSLDASELEELGRLRERLVALIERHNSTGHAKPKAPVSSPVRETPTR